MKTYRQWKKRGGKRQLRLLAIMLCFCLLITACPGMPGTVSVHAAAVTATPGVISSNQEWGEQTLAAGTYTINPGVTVTVSGRLTVTGNVTIKGGGKLVRASSYQGSSDTGYDGSIFCVNGGTLTLENMTVDGENVNAYGSAIYIYSSGTVNLKTNAVIQNNINMDTGSAGTHSAGGIYCEGILNIDGGTIKNCRTSKEVGTSAYSHAGGGIYLKGTCNMTAGSITGNAASNGGGIYLASTGAELRLSGGVMSGNSVAGKGNGIYYSTLNAATSKVYISGNANVKDNIFLDNTSGELYPYITSALHYPVTLSCSSTAEGKILAGGSGHTLTSVDASKISMTGTTLYSRLNKTANQIYLSATEEPEATWQEGAGGAWKTGRFTTALEKVYDGGTIKLLNAIVITEKAEITKSVTITSNDASEPCVMTRMPIAQWGNITINGGNLTLTNVIYDGNRDWIQGTEDAKKQSLIKVGDSASDTEARLTLGTGVVVRDGYKTGGSGLFAVYGTMTMNNGAVIENCEVTNNGAGTGGGVWVSAAGNFIMNGGTIRDCNADGGGAAISTDGTCTLNGGSITGNTDTSKKECAVYLRNSGSGKLTLNGINITGNTYSVYNDDKSVSVVGNSTLSGSIYTTNAIMANGTAVSGLTKAYAITLPDSPTVGTVVVSGSKDTQHYQLANTGYALMPKSDGSSNLVVAQKYKVSFNKNGGNGTTNDIEVLCGGVYGQLPTPTRTGYTFGGWYTAATGGSKVTATTTVTETTAHTLHAHWTANTYTVTYNKNSGTITNESKYTSYTYGTGLTLPTPTKTGYTFGGWYTSSGLTGTAATSISSTTTGDKKYWAKWTDNIAPVIGTLGYSYQPKNFWQWLIGKDSLIITVPVTEEGSGADQITYTLTPEGGTVSEETSAITNGEAKITISADFKGTVAIVCTDKAGNTSASVTVGTSLNATGIIIEDNAPQIEFKANGGDVSAEVYDSAPDITVMVTDDKDNAISAGIASVTYQIGNSEEVAVQQDFTTSMKTNATFTIPADKIPMGETEIIVKAMDHAGNTVTTKQTVKVMADAAKVAAAKKIVEETLAGYTATNGTTKHEIQEKIDTALTNAGISDVTVTVGDLNKTEATTGAAGSISGNVSITKGSVSDSVAIDKTIDKLPITDAAKVEAAKKIVEETLTGCTATNGTTKQEIQKKIDTALTNAGISDVTVTVGDLNRTEATTDAAGSISGNVSITKGSVSDSVPIDKTIDKLPTHTHTWTWVITKAATADEEGKMTGTCTCGEITTEIIPKTGDSESGTVIVKEDKENEYNASLADKEDVKGKVSLTDTEKEHLNTGEDLIIILRLKDVNVAVDTQEKTGIWNKLEANTLGTFLDIELLKQIGGTETKITETTDEIEITFEIPEHIRNTDDTVTRTYQIMRNHDGVVDILDVESYDEAADLLTFKTDKFSTYALVYRDTAKEDKTTETDAERVAKAKKIVEKVLSEMPVTNDTQKESIQQAVDDALKKSGLSDVTVVVGDLTKNPAVAGAEGSLTGVATISKGNVSDSVSISKTIAKLPEDSIITPQQQEKNDITMMAGMKVSQTDKKISISWGKVKGADGYQVYVTYCGKDFTTKPAKIVKSASVTKVSVKKINGKKLNLERNYKVYITAYKTVNGKKVITGKTLIGHIVGKNNYAYTNVKQVMLAKSQFTLKAGNTTKIKAKTVLVDKNKKQLSNEHAQEFRYATSSKKVAAVSKKGKITAVGKGTCTIYVYARNGYAKKIKVKVK